MLLVKLLGLLNRQFELGKNGISLTMPFLSVPYTKLSAQKTSILSEHLGEKRKLFLVSRGNSPFLSFFTINFVFPGKTEAYIYNRVTNALLKFGIELKLS